MKRFSLIMLWFFLLIQAATSQSKVAVLDAYLGEDVHTNASSIVADSINEQFVKSGDYIAIDRTYISHIQAEKQFQLSGEVKDQDIKELGNTFGAEYICIANVSLLGKTYTVSARLIEVESAQVVAQESSRKQGTIDVLFDVAEVVGNKFVGKNLPPKTPPKVKVTDDAKKAQPQPQPSPKPQTSRSSPKPKPDKTKPRARMTFGYMFPGYMGDSDSEYPFYERDQEMIDLGSEFGLQSEASTTSWGLDFHILVPINSLYWSLGTSITMQSAVWEFSDEDSSYETVQSENEYQMFTTVDLTAGAGLVFILFPNMQMYGGLTIGFMAMELGTDYDGDATSPYFENPGESANGFMFGIELGADYFLGDFSFNLKYKLSYVPSLTGEVIFPEEYADQYDTSFGVHGLVLGAGIGW